MVGLFGLSCAWFLALGGAKVSLYESRPITGGMVSGAIPVFRMDEASLRKDLDLIRELGVELHLGQPIDRAAYDTIRATHEEVHPGCWGPRPTSVWGLNTRIPPV